MGCVRCDHEAEARAFRLTEWYQETGKILQRDLLSLYEMRHAYFAQGWATHQAQRREQIVREEDDDSCAEGR